MLLVRADHTQFQSQLIRNKDQTKWHESQRHLPRTKPQGLTYIYGIGRKRSGDILTEAGVSADIRIKDLSEDDVRRSAA